MNNRTLKLSAYHIKREVLSGKLCCYCSVNKHENITNLQKNTAEELQKMGYCASEAKEILGFSYRDALLERASLPESSLRARGYDEKQIAFII